MSGITGGGRGSAQLTANLEDDILAPLELQAWIYGGMNPETRRQMHLALALDRIALCEEVENLQNKETHPYVISPLIHYRLRLGPPRSSAFGNLNVVAHLLTNPSAMMEHVLKRAVMPLGGLSIAAKSYAAAAPLPDLSTIPDSLDTYGQYLDAMIGLAAYSGSKKIQTTNAAALRVVNSRGKRRGESHLAQLKYSSVKHIEKWQKELAPLAPLAMALRRAALFWFNRAGYPPTVPDILFSYDFRIAVVTAAQEIAALAGQYPNTHFDPDLRPLLPKAQHDGVRPWPASAPPLFTPLDDEDIIAANNEDSEVAVSHGFSRLFWQGWTVSSHLVTEVAPVKYKPGLPSGRHEHLVVHAADSIESAAFLALSFIGQDPSEPDDLTASFSTFITEEMDLAHQFNAVRHYAGEEAAFALLRAQILRSTLGEPIVSLTVNDLAHRSAAEFQADHAQNERFLAQAREAARLSRSTFDAIERYAKAIAEDPVALLRHLADVLLGVYGFRVLLNPSAAPLPFKPKQLEYAEIAGATLINLAVMDGFVGNNAAVAERLPRLARSSKAISTLKRAMLLQESHEVIGYDEGGAPKYGSPQLRTIHTAWHRAQYIAPLFAGLALEFHGKEMSPAAGRVANLKPVEVLAHRDPERIRRALSYALWFRDFGTERIDNNKPVLPPHLTVGIAIEGLEPRVPDTLPCIDPDILDELIGRFDENGATNYPMPGDGLYSDQDDVRLKLIRHRIYETTPTEDRLVWPFKLVGEER